jgi:hypothetical protein
MLKAILVLVTNDFFANFFFIKLNKLALISTTVKKNFTFTIYEQTINDFNYGSQ